MTTVQDYLRPLSRRGERRDPRREPARGPAPTTATRNSRNGSATPTRSGWSPDRNSWAVLTAAKNRVFTADDIAPYDEPAQHHQPARARPPSEPGTTCCRPRPPTTGTGTAPRCGTRNVTRGSNLAVAQANQVLTPAALANETTPPTVFVPQREIYNPGGMEWGTTPQPSDFEVWTYAYDVSGLSNVTLKWRVGCRRHEPARLDAKRNLRRRRGSRRLEQRADELERRCAAGQHSRARRTARSATAA